MSPTSTDIHTDIHIVPASWRADAAALAAIRREVFIDEQQVPEALEWDGADAAAQHWLAYANAQPIGCVRLLGNGHIGRMAVRRPWRQRGVGSALLQAVIAHANARELREVYLHAQTHALVFYQSHGFSAEGPEFMDAGIPHRTMRRVLRAQRRLGHDHGRIAIVDRAGTALDIAQQTRRYLRIFADTLAPELYAGGEFADALSRLVRGNRHADIRLLITDSSGLSPSNHGLVALQRRLSTAIRIRKLGAITEAIGENYLVADGCAVLCYSTREPEIAWADYNNVPLTNDYAHRFDELWQHAVEDPNLRVLHL